MRLMTTEKKLILLPQLTELTDFLVSLHYVQLAKSLVNHLVNRILSYSILTTGVISLSVMKWKPTSSDLLAESESKLLSCTSLVLMCFIFD